MSEIEPSAEFRGGSCRDLSEVGLVDEEHVGPFENSRLHELDEVACRRLHHEDQAIDEVDHAGFRLADADGFDKDEI